MQMNNASNKLNTTETLPLRHNAQDIYYTKQMKQIHLIFNACVTVKPNFILIHSN